MRNAISLALVGAILLLNYLIYLQNKRITGLEGYLHELNPNVTVEYHGGEVRLNIRPLAGAEDK